MKYSDCPSVEVELVVNASADRVWRLVSDIDVPARFSSELRGAAWIDSEPGPGARFLGRNEHAALGGWETTSWVTRYEPLRAFEWAVSDPDEPSATWWFTLAEVGSGVLLRQGGRMGPAPSGLTIAIEAMPEQEGRIIARRLEEWRANMQATIEGIKALAEATS